MPKWWSSDHPLPSAEFDKEELSNLTRSVSAIARQMGLLTQTRWHFDHTERFNIPQAEPLWKWILMAEWIQIIFQKTGGLMAFDKLADAKLAGVLSGDLWSGGEGPPAPTKDEFGVGSLGISISYKVPGKPSLRVRPNNAYGLLSYRAAQMIVDGTRSKSCEQCGAPFITGGTRAGVKKRAGARFCSNKCRADYHNAKVRKG